jgi:hypothetical protein
MTDTSLVANAQALPESNPDADAELISDVSTLKKHAAVMLVIREPKPKTGNSIYDEAMPGEEYNDLLELLSDELHRLREKIVDTRLKTNEGIKAKLSAAMTIFELDEDPYLFQGRGSLASLLLSINMDMVNLDAANTAAFEAMAQTMTPPMETVVSLADA